MHFVGLCGLYHAYAVFLLCSLALWLKYLTLNAVHFSTVHHSCALVGLFLDAYMFVFIG